MHTNISYISFILLLLTCTTSSDPDNVDNKSAKKKLTSVKQPPCAACRTLVNSFVKGMDKTSRGKHEGGDADWEERKMKNYAHSEVRLVEIQEQLCSTVERGKDQCHSLSEEYEHLLEEWWFGEESQRVDLLTWLCIDRLRLCCPDNHYGPNCLPCTGGAERPCSGNGKCKGNGTRKGSGQCDCDKGYTSDLCNQCASGYYEAFKDDNSLICSPCHRSCQGTCTQAGPKGCLICNSGWVMDTKSGCQDIDECLTLKPPCTSDQFCVNNEGSYSCIDCHESCDGCDGDGPDMCLKCADGFELQNKICVDKTKKTDKQLNESRHTDENNPGNIDGNTDASVMEQMKEEL